MKPIRSDRMQSQSTDLILRSRAKHGVSKDEAGTISPVAVLRDAHTGHAPQNEVDDVDMIRTSETMY
jgi:hypothetical protein